jgi:hypothetical protein
VLSASTTSIAFFALLMFLSPLRLLVKNMQHQQDKNIKEIEKPNTYSADERNATQG